MGGVRVGGGLGCLQRSVRVYGSLESELESELVRVVGIKRWVSRGRGG